MLLRTALASFVLAAAALPAAGQLVGNLVITPGSVPGGTPASATVSVFNFGNPGSISVSDGGSLLTNVPSTVAFGSQATQVTFPITTRGTPTQAEVTITVTAGNSVAQVLTITPTTFTRTLSFFPTSSLGGTRLSAEYTVSPAPGVPLTITFESSAPGALVAPAPVTIDPQETSAFFGVQTLPPAGAVTTAVLAGTIAGTTPPQAAQDGLSVYPRILRVGAGRPYTTIQSAINASIEGCEIHVDPGTYAERLNVTDPAAAIISTAGPGATIIDSTGVFGSGPAARFSRPFNTPDADWLLRGFTVRGGTDAGVNQERGTLRLEDCIITGNSGDGGLVSRTGVLEATNCLVAGNTITGFGGACTIGNPPAGTRAVLVNCTIIGGAGGSTGSAVSSDGRVSLLNCILRGGAPAATGTELIADRCNIEGGYPGHMIITGDPMFAGPSDYRLAAGSPCIDAGSTAAYHGGTTDLGLGRRAVDDPATPNAAIGPGPPVDLGAYEFQAGDCRVDMDNNNTVNSSDISAFLTAWLQAISGGCP